ncbi:MAG: hypothetical protein QOJ32_2393 [Frankiaceae bacterium]|jgi:hypothetical protein|nr:hypothetical protein [Frankiaceae bacterium]MDQ1635584.1 hypothetical protein [Frankiaceae bacterium]MDQ1648956.1 hypothetical protein [Frankiaceae bacterium]
MRRRSAQLKRIQERTASWVRSAPGTYTYLFALAVTSWSLRGVDPHLADALIRSQSTNLDNLTDRPLQVLVASAFWTSGPDIPLRLLVRFTLVMAPVERRLGTRRTLAVFAAGHVFATLLVAAGLSYGVQHRLISVSVAHASDVGVSYGFVAVAGAMTWLLATRWRLLWVAALAVSLSVSASAGVTFTDVGHLVSLVIGLATAPLIKRWLANPPAGAVLGGQQVSLAWLHRLNRRRSGRAADGTAEPSAALARRH